MHDFEASTLWSISSFQRARDAAVGTPLGDDRATLLPTTLLADLRRLHNAVVNDDVLEVVAACMRHHEAALLYLRHGSHVWPVTLFPREWTYHSSRSVSHMMADHALSKITVMSAEPPGVRPSDHAMQERVAGAGKYHPMAEFLWAVALHGPRAKLLTEINGRIAYRVVSSSSMELPASLGALSLAVERLRGEGASLRDIAAWPGLSLQRASRLLNALYLTGALMVSRTHPAARRPPLDWRGLLGRRGG